MGSEKAIYIARCNRYNVYKLAGNIQSLSNKGLLRQTSAGENSAISFELTKEGIAFKRTLKTFLVNSHKKANKLSFTDSEE